MKNEVVPVVTENTTTSSSKAGLSVEVLNKLVEQNNTLMEKVIELSKDRQVINYQNCGNKKMTINVFLNQECKNANTFS